MRTRPVGNTKVELSEVSLGTFGLAANAYGVVEDERFERVVRAAIRTGVTTIDVAPLWGHGRSEEVVGRVLRELEDEAEEVQIISRAGVSVDGAKVRRGFKKDELIEECEASLRRLHRERIEVFLLHGPTEDELQQDGYREAFETLKRDGKIGAAGASVASVDEARAVIDAKLDAVCLPYNLLNHDAVHDLSFELKEAGCSVIARSPLFHGLLAGRWPATRRFQEDDHRSHRWNRDALRIRVREVNQLRFLVRGDVHSMTTAAMRFVLANDMIATAVLGARSAYQIEDAELIAGEPPFLSEDLLARLPQVLAAIR